MTGNPHDEWMKSRPRVPVVANSRRDDNIRKQPEYRCVHPLRFGDEVMYACLALAVLVKIVLWIADL
ncbi:MAG: hypothetical protein OXE73_01435 [Gammaproteobacteria bacterium]|nr:hypothetical protein [Gammaproteobacteria bacterium]